MSQCVPSWEIEDQINPSTGLPLEYATSVTAAAASANIDSRKDYEVAELTWVDGHPSMHGHGQLRLGKSMSKCPSTTSWGKDIARGAVGTLESVVDQGTRTILFPSFQLPTDRTDYNLVPWISPNQRRNCSSEANPSASTVVMDALVPCANRTSTGLLDDSSTHVPSDNDGGCDIVGRKRRRGGNCSVSGSVASLVLPDVDTCDINDGADDVGFTTSTSPIDCYPDTENTSCGRAVTVADEFDSASHDPRLQREECVEDEGKRKAGGDLMRSSISTKRSRAAAVHNQSERKRRDRINQRMKALQKLVPNSSKTDKASMLDEVIDYLKQLQGQVEMMNRMNTIPHMMMAQMPMSMQQLQMTMIAQMTQMAQMGMGMAMGMDMNGINPAASLARTPIHSSTTPLTTPQIVQPSAFFPFVNPSWEGGSGDRPVQPPVSGSVLPVDPFSAFMTCQPQKSPMTMDALSRMTSMYQQLYQQPPHQNQNLNPKRQ